MKEMLVRDLMTKNVVIIPSTISMREIAKVMEREDVSGVAVESPEHGIIGIISECDMLRHFGERNWELKTAEEIMTPNVESVLPETTLLQAVDAMQKRHIHRLIVFGRDLNEPPVPVGIINASDIVKQIGRDSI